MKKCLMEAALMFISDEIPDCLHAFAEQKKLMKRMASNLKKKIKKGRKILN